MALPNLIGQGIGAGGNLIGGIFNAVRSAKDRKRARGYFNDGLNALRGQKVLEQDKLYRKLKFGEGVDDLRRYQQGTPLQYNTIGDTNLRNIGYDSPSQMALRRAIQGTTDFTSNNLTGGERAQLNEILKRQRFNNQAVQNNLTRNAIAQGRDPNRVGLTQRLLGAQAEATRGSNLGNNLAQQIQQRQATAYNNLGNLSNVAFNQQARIQQAQDNIDRLNANRLNEQKLLNFRRRNTVLDNNVEGQNNLVNQNTNNEINAYRDSIGSYNTRQLNLADAYNNRAAQLYGRAQERGRAAQTNFRNAARGAGNFATTLDQWLTPNAQGQTPMQIWRNNRRRQRANTRAIREANNYTRSQLSPYG